MSYAVQTRGSWIRGNYRGNDHLHPFACCQHPSNPTKCYAQHFARYNAIYEGDDELSAE
jgi:hypothetical protein